MKLKNATPDAIYQFRVRARLSEVREGLQSTPKTDFEKGKLKAWIGAALEIAADKRALPKLRADAISAASGAISSKSFTDEELADFERRASAAARVDPSIELSSALEGLRNAMSKSRERGRGQQALF